MLGVVKKTSLVLLLCLTITFHTAFGETCGLVENCGNCLKSPRGYVCSQCQGGYDIEMGGGFIAKCTKPKPSECFPGSSMVTTARGNIAMETLHSGDSVLTYIGNNELGFTKVVGFAQREPGKEGHYLSITAVNQAGGTRTVKLTPSHNIYVKSKIGDHHADYIPRFAADVLIGDILKIQTDNGTAEATVTHVTLHKEMGVYNPLTETGTMLVDGTLVSCYGSFNHQLAHIATAPIRWFPWMFADEEKPLEGQLPYVETIKYIARSYVVPFVSLQ